jgi:N-acetylglutamate synthase-like GNAT family acetyltransferase
VDNLVIRNLQIDDAAAISRIFAAITKTEIKLDYKQVVEEQIAADGATSFVAEIDGKVVGLMVCKIISSGFGLLEKSAWIVMFGIDPSFMGEGIGKKLAHEIFTICREQGIKKIYSSVRWDSVDLLSFFKTLGFDRSNFINLEKTLE